MTFEINSPIKITTVLFMVIIMSLFSLAKLNLVNGHAIPDGYTLEPNSLLEESKSFPSSISILFSERPDPKVSYIHVTNSEGNQIDNDDFKITGENDRRGTISVDKNLIKEGVYSVSWSTLSLDDGHASKGTYVVGVEFNGSLPSNNNMKNVTVINTLYSPIISLVKAPIIIGQVYVLGFVFSQIIIWKDIRRRGLGNIIDSLLIGRFTYPIMILSIIIAAAATIIPIIQSAIISETQSEYIKILALLYFGTANGIVLIIRVLCCAIMAFAAYYYRRTIINGYNSTTNQIQPTILLYVLLIAVLVFAGTNSVTSHSASLETYSQLGILADFIHSILVSIWIGGLMYVFYVLFPNVNTIGKKIAGKVQQSIAQPKSILLLTLSRFSVISTICVGLIGITGLCLAWLHISNVDDLLLSDYGRTLIVKLCIVLPVIILGAYHQFWISRTIRVLDFEGVDDDESSKTNFSKKFSSVKKTIKIECLLAASVLCAASVLTMTSPPASMQNNGITQSNLSSNVPSAMQNEFVRTLETQRVPIVLVISPFVTGFNNITVNFVGSNESVGKVSNVSIEFKKSDLSLGPIFAKLSASNETSYSIEGGYLSQPGQWDVKIIIQRSNLYDLIFRTSFTVNSSSSMHDQHEVEPTQIVNNSSPPSIFTPLVIILSVIVSALSTYFCINSIKRLKIAQRSLGI